ncbi:uncharacterized protein LOC144118507 [Amblyomma americanum]
MARRDSGPSWYFFETRDSIRILMAIYGLITFLAGVSEVTSAIVVGRNTEYHRRPYIWIMGGTYASLRFITLGVIIYWIVAASKGNIRSMRIGFNIIFVRVLGNLLYGLGSFFYDSFLVKDTLARRYRQIIHPDLVPKDVVLITLLAWTVTECVMLDRMNHYEMYRAGAEKTPAPISRVLSPAELLSPTAAWPRSAVTSPTGQQTQSAAASRVVSPSVLSPPTARPLAGASRVASPTSSVPPQRPWPPAEALSPVRRAVSAAPSRVGSPTVGYAPTK